jgi:polysaccharide biosynthesis/export protein PslD
VIVDEVGQRKVYVGGEVRNPGFVFYREGMTPLQAILDRGGFTDVARSDSVLKISGVEATRLDLSKTLRQGNPELSTLIASDVLYVPRTFIGDANSFVRLYFHNLLPVTPRAGVGFAP